MTEVMVVGAGGHAAEIDEYVAYSHKLNGKGNLKIIGFLDDNPESYSAYQFSAPYLGSLQDHRVNGGQKYLMGIANMKYRKHFIETFLSEGAVFVSFAHPSAFVSPSARVGEGTIIGPHANIGPNVRVGKHNLINSRCSLGHDTRLGDLNFISPNVCFSGFTLVGDENLFGINSATIPGIRIGNRNRIAAGMVLNQPVGDDATVFYRYKEKIIAVPR